MYAKCIQLVGNVLKCNLANESFFLEHLLYIRKFQTLVSKHIFTTYNLVLESLFSCRNIYLNNKKKIVCIFSKSCCSKITQ